MANFKNSKKFIEYLENILIPDLKLSGHDATAQDFEESIYWIKERN